MADEKESNTPAKNENPLPPSPEENKTGQSSESQKDTQNTANIQQELRPIWWKDKDKREIALVLVTGFLAIFTAWMAWETHKLSGDSAKQVEAAATSAKATEKSAVATEHSADAAVTGDSLTRESLKLTQTSIAIAEMAAKIENRAYLIIDSVKPVKIVHHDSMTTLRPSNKDSLLIEWHHKYWKNTCI